MKRIVRIAAACLALLMLGACAKTPDATASDPAVSGTTASSGGSTTGSTGSTDGSASESGGSTDSTSDGTDNTEVPVTTSTTKASVTDPSGHTLEIAYDWHPGVPGYDAVYEMAVRYDGAPIHVHSLSYASSTAGVSVSGGRVTVTESVRERGTDVEVTVTHTSSGLSASTRISCKTWVNTFNDDFNGDSLDHSLWSDFEPNTVSEGKATDSSVTVSGNYIVKDGILSLLCTKDPVTVNGKTYEYSSASIATDKSFLQKYGCFMARIKIPKEGGINSAFWLIPSSYGKKYGAFLEDQPNVGCGEVDIIEASVFWNNQYCITEHYFDYTDGYRHSSQYQYITVDGSICDWHTYAVVWTEDAFYYYCDGQLVRRKAGLTSDGVNGNRSQRMFMLLSMYMFPGDDTWIGPHDFTDASFPIHMDVDWARAYK